MDNPANRDDGAGAPGAPQLGGLGVRPDADTTCSIIYSNMEEIVFHLTVESDGQYRFLFVNPAFENATALSPERVLGRLVAEVIPEPSCSLVLAQYRESIRSGAARHWE